MGCKHIQYGCGPIQDHTLVSHWGSLHEVVTMQTKLTASHKHGAVGDALQVAHICKTMHLDPDGMCSGETGRK